MKLQDITVSQKLAKELKEAGYQQDSLFYWKNYMLTAYGYSKEDVWWLDDETYDDEDNASNNYIRERKLDQKIYSAPTVSELGEALNNYCKDVDKCVWHSGIEKRKETQYIDGKELVEKKITTSWETTMFSCDGKGWGWSSSGDGKSEANARAKMWLYLKKEDLL